MIITLEELGKRANKLGWEVYYDTKAGYSTMWTVRKQDGTKETRSIDSNLVLCVIAEEMDNEKALSGCSEQ